VKDILSPEAFDLLKDLSNINPELETNLERRALKKTYQAGFDRHFNELIDAGMLDKKNKTEGIYEFTYRHIRDILNDDAKKRHERAREYYENKINKNQDDEVEILYHRSISSQDENLINAFLELAPKLNHVHYGFRRMVDVGELLRKSFNDDRKAPVCSTLGILYNNLRKFEAADTAYTEALAIVKKLAEKAPDVYLPYVATTQNNLGNLYRDLRKFEAAE
jgi:tetratricopeptide (TPR) repeat protein